MRLSTSLLIAAAALCQQAFAESSFTLGTTDAQRCYEESRQPFSEDGLRFCNRAIKEGDLTRRDLAATHSNRGVILAASGKYQEAIADHDEAIRLLPTLGQAYINRGNAYYHIRDFEQALSDYDEAMNLKAEPAHIPHYNRALVLIRLKRVDEARSALEQALALAPDSTRIKDRLKELKELE